MRILIYKRTHTGDPNDTGLFGVEDCMGRIRNWNFDAVIGIGGKTTWKGHEGIKQKINWIGLSPKIVGETSRGKILAFKNFELYEEKGQNIEEEYKNLFKYMYQSRKRFDMALIRPKLVSDEIDSIIESIKDSPSSKLYDAENSTYSELEKNCNYFQIKTNLCGLK